MEYRSAAGRGSERGAGLAAETAERCWTYLRPLLRKLDAQVDVRLVRTLANTVAALVRHRNRPLGLLLSELGAYLTGPTQAPAGTKRLANLLHSRRWRAEAIDAYLLEQGAEQVVVEAQRVPEGRALCILDGSVLEKPESSQAEGLRPVRSSQARRLSRPRPKLGKGYWRGKPGGPVVVPGWQWVGVLVTGWAAWAERRPLVLGAWHWYARISRTDEATRAAAEPVPFPEQSERTAQQTVLERVVAAWGTERLLHVWDRGLSGAGWLGTVLDQRWHFVVRWKKGNRLRPAEAPSVGDPTATPHRRERDSVPAWQLTRGRRAWGQRTVANPRNPHQPLTVAFLARPVCLVHRPDPLWLVVVRLGKSTPRRRGGTEPWRLLTTEPVATEEQCWRIVQAYAARWQVELMLRFGKADLGLESVRVRAWEPRRKLLALAALAYAFLIHLLASTPDALRAALLRWAHRTGRQAQQAAQPLSRLRSALAFLWQKHTPAFQGFP